MVVPKDKIGYVVLGLLALIAVFGLVLRVYAISQPNMWIDEMISSLVSREIRENGYPILDSGFLYTRAILFHYLMAFSTFIFQGDLGARLISVLFGVATIILSFFIGREYDGGKEWKITALTAALFTSVMFLEILYSRQARFYQMFQFFFFLTLYFLYKSKENKKFAWLATISLVILIDTQVAGLVLLPFFFLLFFYENRDWKLFAIPSLILIYYIPTFFSLRYGNASLASTYVEQYTSTLFYRLRGFSFIALLGLPLAFRWNRRATLIFLLPSFILFGSILFLRVFASRYSYFIILTAIILMSCLISAIFRYNKLLFVIVLFFAITYPSNLFHDSGTLTLIRPQEVSIGSNTEPSLNYKGLSAQTKDSVMKSSIVTLWSPGVAWYFKPPSYVIPFSLNGLDTGYQIYNNKDTYSGAELFNLDNPQEKTFILIEDIFGLSKLSPSERQKLSSIKSSCALLDQTENVKVYDCKLS